MEKLKLNKKADLSVTVLVFLVVGLVGASLFVFITNTNKTNTEIQEYGLRDIYAVENEIDFYVYDILENTINLLGSDKSKERFIFYFKESLENYKVDGEYVISELGQIEGQITEENIEILGNEIKIKLDFGISIDKEKRSVAYSYEKEFTNSLISKAL